MLHTKGPWKFDQMGERIWILSPNDIYLAEIIIDDEEDKFIKPDSEREANAVLMAAAPEMYTALQEMINEYEIFMDIPENYKELEGYPGDENPRTLAFLKAKEIMEKATLNS